MKEDVIPKTNASEKSSCVIDYYLKDPSTDPMVGVSNSNITTAEYRIRNLDNDALITPAEQWVDFKSSFDSEGHCLLSVPANYNAMVSSDDDKKYEDHILIMKVIFNAIGGFTHTRIINWLIRVEAQEYTE